MSSERPPRLNRGGREPVARTALHRLGAVGDRQDHAWSSASFRFCPNLRMSRSYTSRPARAGERDGVDYNFISRVAFEQRIQAAQFLEWADVFGNYYGTGSPTSSRCCRRGRTWCWSSTCKARVR